MNLLEITTAVRAQITYDYDGIGENIRLSVNDRCTELIRKCPNLWFMQPESEMDTVADQAAYALPDDFAYSMLLYYVDADTGATSPLTDASKDGLIRHAPGHEGADGRGRPSVWVLWHDKLELEPIPDAVYRLRLIYWAKPVMLAGDESSNLVTVNASQAIMAGVIADMAFADQNMEIYQHSVMRWNDALMDLRKENATRVLAGGKLMTKRLNKYGAGSIRERGR